MESLKNKLAVITGAGSGIGEAIAKNFAEVGGIGKKYAGEWPRWPGSMGHRIF